MIFVHHHPRTVPPKSPQGAPPFKDSSAGSDGRDGLGPGVGSTRGGWGCKTGQARTRNARSRTLHIRRHSVVVRFHPSDVSASTVAGISPVAVRQHPAPSGRNCSPRCTDMPRGSWVGRCRLASTYLAPYANISAAASTVALVIRTILNPVAASAGGERNKNVACYGRQDPGRQVPQSRSGQDGGSKTGDKGAIILAIISALKPFCCTSGRWGGGSHSLGIDRACSDAGLDID